MVAISLPWNLDFLTLGEFDGESRQIPLTHRIPIEKVSVNCFNLVTTCAQFISFVGD